MRFRELPDTSDFFADFVEGVEKAAAFLPYPAARFELLHARANELRQRAFPRAQIAALLEQQARGQGAPARIIENIRRVGAGEAAVVLAAHPAALFGGVLQPLVKAAGAARLARELEKAGVPAVAVSWIDEFGAVPQAMRCLRMLDSEARLRSFSLPRPPNGGAMRQPAAVPPQVRELSGDIQLLTAAADPCLFDGLGRAYSPGERFSAATARFLSTLLQRLGIIVITPQDADFDQLARASARQLVDPAGVRAATDEVCQALERSGYSAPQASPVGLWRIDPDGIASAAATRSMLSAVLPCVAAAVDYDELYAQAAGARLSRMYGLDEPVVCPSASATLVDARSRKTMDRYGLQFHALLSGSADVLRTLSRQEAIRATAGRLHELKEALQTGLRDLSGSSVVDPPLKEEIDKAGGRILFQLQRVESRFATAAASRNDALARQVERLCNSLAPETHLQERTLAMLHFLNRYSDALVEKLCNGINPWLFEHQLIEVD